MLKFNNNDSGYTLVETLVALTLLLILLFFSTEILNVLSLNKNSALKLAAINAAKNRMEQTLLLHDYKDFEKEIAKNLELKQSIKKHDELILITISVYQKNPKRGLYQLKVYVPNEKK
jgi:prepilin-type N-terminal cleavage/methylation domain-containing protein